MNTSAPAEDLKRADPEQTLWEELDAAAAKYRVLSATIGTVWETAPEKKRVEKKVARRLVFAGLRVKLSEVLAEIKAENREMPANGLASLVIYADTLVLDKPVEIAAYNVVLVARLVDARPLGQTPLEFKVLEQVPDLPAENPGGKPAGKLKQTMKVLAGSVEGTLRLAAKKGGVLLDGRWTPKPGVPLGIELCNVDENGVLEPARKVSAGALADLVKRPLALSAFKAAFAAAGYLVRFDDDEKSRLAVGILRWAEACLQSADAMANEGELLFSELADQVSSLLIPLQVRGGAYFVPTLSGEFYRAQMDQLLGALESHESHLAGLETRTDIGTSLQVVSDGMRHAAVMEVAPLKTELGMVRENMQVLEQSIAELNRSFSAQSFECKKLYDELDVALRKSMDNKLIMQGIKFAMSGVSVVYNFQGVLITKSAGNFRNIGAKPWRGDSPVGTGDGSASMDDLDAGGSPGGGALNAMGPSTGAGIQDPQKLYDNLKWDKQKSSMGDALKQYGLQAAEVASAFADILRGTGADDAMIGKAHQLFVEQQRLTSTLIEAARTWEKAFWSDLEVPERPEALNAHKIDPGRKWDDFVRQADVSLKGLGAPKHAANYLSGLTTLAELGKAISAKTIVYCEQIARGTVLKAQIAAITNIAESWKSQETKSQSDLEKLAALKGMIQLRMDSIRQSIYVAWTYYRNSYFYLYFRKPPVVIGPEMNAAQLRDGLNAVSRWVAKLLGEDGAANAITMPSRQARIVFELPVVRAGEPAPDAKQVARLEPATDTSGAKLRWTIPLRRGLGEGEENPLAGVLPQGGDVAIWVEEAKLVFDGLKPNAKGNGIVWLGTSGHYQNGFDGRRAYSFVNRPMGGYYCFRDQETYVPWMIQAGLYQMPTPFTQWSAIFDKEGGDPSEVTKLRLELVVSFCGRT